MKLVGTVDGVSFTSSDLKAIYNLIGSISGQSDTVGAFSAMRTFGGSSDTVTTLDATLKRMKSLRGTSVGVSALSGTPIFLIKLVGSVEGQSGLSGDLTVVGGAIYLMGSIVGSSDLSSTIMAIRNIGGDIYGEAVVSNATLKLIRDFNGDINALSELIGSLDEALVICIKKIFVDITNSDEWLATAHAINPRLFSVVSDSTPYIEVET